MIHLTAIGYSHPVAVVQYTYAYKQHRERHKTNNTYNNTKIRKSAGRALSLRVFPLAFALQLRKKHGKNLSQGSHT